MVVFMNTVQDRAASHDPSHLNATIPISYGVSRDGICMREGGFIIAIGDEHTSKIDDQGENGRDDLASLVRHDRYASSDKPHCFG